MWYAKHVHASLVCMCVPCVGACVNAFVCMCVCVCACACVCLYMLFAERYEWSGDVGLV